MATMTSTVVIEFNECEPILMGVYTDLDQANWVQREQQQMYASARVYVHNTFQLSLKESALPTPVWVVLGWLEVLCEGEYRPRSYVLGLYLDLESAQRRRQQLLDNSEELEGRIVRTIDIWKDVVRRPESEAIQDAKNSSANATEGQ